MFIILLTYLRPLEELEAHLPAHRKLLDEGYAAGFLLASGPRVPRTGGVILAHGISAEVLNAFLERDPFKQAGIASYEVLEFTPVKIDPRLQAILEPGLTA